MRISRLDKSQVDEQTAEVYDWFLQSRGNVPNMFRTVAHRPEIMQTAVAHLRAIMETGTVPKKIKQLVITRTSQVNRCEY
jgi:alkylhydroperoxidase family enzyme